MSQTPPTTRPLSWSVIKDGDDLIVKNVRATCFGGASDPQDNGQTASGISTKAHPDLAACSLPMNFGSKVPNTNHSPIPRVPWHTEVVVEDILSKKQLTLPVIDIGPALKTGNAIDLTVAAARWFRPNASASNFEMMCNFRILGGAKYL